MFWGRPPAPVSNIPPPFIKGTIDNIFAEVLIQELGISLLNNHIRFPLQIVSNLSCSSNVKLVAD
jgi:hypothetical protein